MDLSSSILSTGNIPIMATTRFCSPSQRLDDRRKLLQKELLSIQSRFKNNILIKTVAKSKYKEWTEKTNYPTKSEKKKVTPGSTVFKNNINIMKKMYSSKPHHYE